MCETVLGLRCGGGIDVLLHARRVETSGTAYGVGMTDKMLTPGLPERREAGVINVEFVEGIIDLVAENHLDPAQRAERGAYVGAHC